MRSQGMEGETPTRQRDTPECSQGAEEGRATPEQKCALNVRSQGIEGDTPTRQWVPPAHSQGMEEGGTPPEKQHALPVNGL